MSEVFYPDLSTPERPQPGARRDRRRDLHRPDVARHRPRCDRPDPRSLRFTQVNTDDDGRYRITETVRHLARPRQRRRAGAAGVARRRRTTGSTRSTTRPSTNDGMDDRARTRGDGLLATDGDASPPHLRRRDRVRPGPRADSSAPQRPVARPEPTTTTSTTAPTPPGRATWSSPAGSPASPAGGAPAGDAHPRLRPRRRVGRASRPAPPATAGPRTAAALRRRLAPYLGGLSRCRPAPPP